MFTRANLTWIPCHGCNHIGSWLNHSQHTCARNNTHHLHAFVMRTQHGKYYFLVFLWQDKAVGLNVKCSKRVMKSRTIHTQFRIYSDVMLISRTTRKYSRHNILGQDFSSGSRGHSDLLGLNTSCTKLYSPSSAQILSDEHRLLRRQLPACTDI